MVKLSLPNIALGVVFGLGLGLNASTFMERISNSRRAEQRQVEPQSPPNYVFLGSTEEIVELPQWEYLTVNKFPKTGPTYDGTFTSDDCLWNREEDCTQKREKHAFDHTSYSVAGPETWRYNLMRGQEGEGVSSFDDLAEQVDAALTTLPELNGVIIESYTLSNQERHDLASRLGVPFVAFFYTP